MTQVTGDWRTNQNTQQVCAALADFQIYFVGGCVRNALLNAPVADIDLSTNATPYTVMRAAQRAGLKAIPTGIEHGTVTILSGGIPHEITTFRKDVATDGRRAVVEFAESIEQDALRRDFTMNALYAKPDGTLVDPLGGLPDLMDRRVRFIENADQRIKEDYLRMLRFFRFHAWYGDAGKGLDPEGLAACATNVEGLDTLSKERIGAEMLKLLSAPDPAPSVAAMAAMGGLMRVLPGSSHDYLAPLVHLEDQREPNGLRRLAVLGGIDVQDALRLSKKSDTRLQTIRQAALDDEKASTMAYKYGADNAKDAILIRCALSTQLLPETLERDLEKGASARFPIQANDLMPKLQGAALGRALKDLENRWIESDFALTKAQLLELFLDTP